MSPQEEPKLAGLPEDPELESTDGGWDPYVTSLLMSAGRSTLSSEDEDGEPVMSFSTTGKRKA